MMLFNAFSHSISLTVTDVTQLESMPVVPPLHGILYALHRLVRQLSLADSASCITPSKHSKNASDNDPKT